MEFEKVLYARRSVRSYTGEKPAPEQMSALLRAAWSAPIGCAEYDRYRIHVVEDPAFLKEIESAHGELTNLPGKAHLFGAPVLIILSTVLPGGELDNRYYSSAACMAENITLQATALGLGSCLVWGAIRSMNKCPALLKKLGLPEGFVPVCSVCVGKTDAVLGERTVPENRIETVYV